MVEVPLGGVVADEVRVVMQARENTHMIVSEVEINALAASASSVTDLARVTVDNALLDGFDPARDAYTIDTNGAAWPKIGAVAVDAVRLVTAEPVQAYAAVFAAEGLLFLVAVVLAARLDSAPAPDPVPLDPAFSVR